MMTESVNHLFYGLSRRQQPSDLVSQVSYLREQDDPLRWQAPRGFNRCAELRRFERFVADLEGRLSRKLDYALGSGVDEAPFHGELFLAGSAVRASNFGRMLAVLDADSLNPITLSLVKTVGNESGYVLIEETALYQPYCDARGSVTTGLETWGSRFFGCPVGH